MRLVSHLQRVGWILVFCGCNRGCEQESDPPIEHDDTAAAAAATYGIASRLAVLVLDGARMDETFADETDFNGGWSDAWDGYTDEILPLIRSELLPTGAVIQNGYLTGVTLTTPAHADLLTGRREPYLPLSHSEGLGHYQLHYPTLHETLRSHIEGDDQSTWIIGNTAHLEPLAFSHYPGLGEALAANSELLFATGDDQGFEEDDGVPVASAREHLARGARMVLANLHQIDRAGHNRPATYATTVAATDSVIVDFQSWLANGSGLGDQTLTLLLADHGRHHVGESEQYPFTNHGCHCSGCREVPMFLQGPGVKRNVSIEAPVIMEDLTSTAAWLLGVPMPYSTGLVLTDALVGSPEVEQRSGATRVAGSGSLLATQQWEDDRHHRSSLLVGGEPLGDPGSLQVEEPRVISGPAAEYACWRELKGTEGDEYRPWQLECAHREPGGDWLDADFPDDVQWPHVAPSLATPEPGSLVLAYANSISSTVEGWVSADRMVLELARWSAGEGWVLGSPPDLAAYYPTNPVLAASEDKLWVAFTASEDQHSARYTRRIQLYALSWPQGEEPDSRFLYQAESTDSSGRTDQRQEHPALVVLGDALHLAWHGYDDDGVHLVSSYATSPRQPSSWRTPQALDDSGRVFGHVPPSWGQTGQLYWARESDLLTAEVCRALIFEWLPDCRDLGVPWIDSLAATDGGVLVSFSAGDGLWETEELIWPD